MVPWGGRMSRVRGLLLVFAVSLFTRLIAWQVLERQVAAEPGRLYVVAGDADGYWDLGGDIAAGREYAVHHPPRRAMRSPGLPIVIAASVRTFGDSRPAARGVLATVTALGPVAVTLIAGVWFPGAAAVAAGLLAAVSPLAVGLSACLLSDGLFATLLVWQGVPLAVAWGGGRQRVGWLAAAAGALGAAAVLVRAAWLPAAVAIAVVWFWRARSDRWSAVIYMLALTAGLLPWAVRNGRAVGVFTPTTLWVGPTLYDSFRPGSDGGSDMRFFDADADLRAAMSEAEVNRHYRDATLAVIRDDPAAAARLAVRKQARFWSLWPRETTPGGMTGKAVIAGWSLLVLALGGVAAWRQRRQVDLLLVTLAPLLYFALLHLVFVGSPRYRMPAELPVCVLAVAATLSRGTRELPATAPQ